MRPEFHTNNHFPNLPVVRRRAPAIVVRAVGANRRIRPLDRRCVLRRDWPSERRRSSDSSNDWCCCCSDENTEVETVEAVESPRRFPYSGWAPPPEDEVLVAVESLRENPPDSDDVEGPIDCNDGGCGNEPVAEPT